LNLAAGLPARLTCLLCFSPQAMERRYDKRGKPYVVCGLCHARVFLANDTQVFGLLFWAQALADENLVRAARGDLEKALQLKGARDPLTVPVSQPACPNPAAVPAPGVPVPGLGG